MSEKSGGGGSSWDPTADQNQEQDSTTTGMSVGAGMGGFNSYNPTGPIGTSIDESEEGEEDGDGMTANEGSTGGRNAGRG